jgi:hypothetical protein
VSLVVGELVTFSCFGLGHLILAGSPAPAASLSQPAVFRAVALSGVVLALLGLIGAGLGAALRRTAGAIGADVALIFVLPILLAKIPGNGSRYTPLLITANSIAAVLRNPSAVAPAVGFGIIVLYAAALAGLGAAVVTRRDP